MRNSYFDFSSEIKINFCVSRKVFEFSSPIFSLKEGLHQQVIQYVQARKDHVFKPHKTQFCQIGNQIVLFQEIPFLWGFQPGFRQKVSQFQQLAHRCHSLLADLALEETLQAARHLI